MSLRVVSYNVLADAYVRPAYFPRTAPDVFRTSRRHPALADRIAALSADVVCLQEVERDVLDAVRTALPEHQRHFEPKRGKPDGIAIFTRARAAQRTAIVYADGTGHVALFVVVDHEGRRLGIANTHIKWGPPPGAPVAVGEGEALLDAVEHVEPACDGWLLCGDYNATPDSVLVKRIRARGFRDAYERREGFTSNANAKAKRIDFVFHSASLDATPIDLPAIDDETPLPSEVEPSDHLPIGADLVWRT